MNAALRPIVLFLPWLGGATAVAQSPGPQALPPLLVPIHTAAADLGVPYGTWAGTTTYKVSFHDGMTFVPYLGDQYPHNQPWSWRTTSARLGSEELLRPETAPVHRHGDHRYEYDFGLITEAYDVRTDGVEQTFVLRRLVAGGDLVITGAVTSALRSADAAAAHQALEFQDGNGRSIVRYGEAWAIDGNGDRLPITTAHRGSVITLTVPGGWLASAALPVIVDPLTSPTSPVGTTSVIKTVDCSYKGLDVVGMPLGPPNTIVPRVLRVIVLGASQFDDDVLAVTSYTGNHIVFADISANWDSDDASCAVLEDSGVDATGDWLIAWRRYFAGSPIRVSQLRFHAVPCMSSSLSTSYSSFTTPVGINDLRPDVGGVALAGDDALVVFQREDNTNTAGHWAQTASSGVYGVFVDLGPGSPPDGTIGVPFAIFDTTNGDAERPALNPVAPGGSSFSWLCVFQVYDNSVAGGDDWDLYARRIGNNGLMTLALWQSQIGPLDTQHQLAPVIAGQGDRYAVSFATVSIRTAAGSTGASRGTAIWVERIDWAHNATLPTASHPPAQLASDAAQILEVTGMTQASSSQWAIGFRKYGSPSPSAFAARVGYRGIATEGPLQLNDPAEASTSSVRCTVDVQSGGIQFDYAVQRGTGWDVMSRDLLTTVPGPVVVAGTSCSNETLTWVGNSNGRQQQIGVDSALLSASGPSPQTIHLMAVSLARADLPIAIPGVASGCRLLVDLGPAYLGMLPIAFGTQAYWPLPLPETLVPMTLHFQDWTLEGARVTSSRRLEVPLVK